MSVTSNQLSENLGIRSQSGRAQIEELTRGIDPATLARFNDSYREQRISHDPAASAWHALTEIQGPDIQASRNLAQKIQEVLGVAANVALTEDTSGKPSAAAQALFIAEARVAQFVHQRNDGSFVAAGNQNFNLAHTRHQNALEEQRALDAQLRRDIHDQIEERHAQEIARAEQGQSHNPSLPRRVAGRVSGHRRELAAFANHHRDGHTPEPRQVAERPHDPSTDILNNQVIVNGHATNHFTTDVALAQEQGAERTFAARDGKPEVVTQSLPPLQRQAKQAPRQFAGLPTSPSPFGQH